MKFFKTTLAPLVAAAVIALSHASLLTADEISLTLVPTPALFAELDHGGDIKHEQVANEQAVILGIIDTDLTDNRTHTTPGLGAGSLIAALCRQDPSATPWRSLPAEVGWRSVSL